MQALTVVWTADPVVLKSRPTQPLSGQVAFVEMSDVTQRWGMPATAAERRADIRRKSLLILVHHYLQKEGFEASAQQLEGEAQLTPDNFSVCEDSDLDSVLGLYERWYCDKFEKYPRFARRTEDRRGDSGGPESPKKKASKKPPPDLVEHNPVGEDLSRRRSLPRRGVPALGRYRSDPNLSDAGKTTQERLRRPRDSPDNRALDSLSDKRRKHSLMRKPLVGRKWPGEEKKDRTKSSSDSDSDKGNRSAPSSGSRTNNSPFQPFTPARMGHQMLDLKAMISDYTRLEDHIGDIGRNKQSGAEAAVRSSQAGANAEETGEDLLDEKAVKGPTSEIPSHLTGDMKDLASAILREVVVHNPAVSWSDVLGVEDAKKLLKEAVVYPLKYPQLFVGRFKPWRGVLLYGPPGTGKTLLAKAVATECKTTFFNISATTLVSKWRGDSEKLVRVLFEMARHHAPSTIFVDELDALMGSRAGDQEHEASRRMKTQLLVELDGLTAANEHVFLLAASNIPWELDPAMLRRLEKRILVPLPCGDARSAMFFHHLPPALPDLAEAGHTVATHLDYNRLAQVLFEMARHHAPSTIFVDELDALMGSRAGDQEHEASRRMKTQLLVELDGLTAANEHVFLLAASNIPWELDPAMLRRLEKRILVPLPCGDARSAMFFHHLPPALPDLAEAGHTVATHLDYNRLAQLSEGYSGSDLKVVCREAAMSSLRKIFKILEDQSVEDEDLPELELEDISMTDVEAALQRTKPAQQDSQQYVDWHHKFGSV
ncbi:ATPase AAA-type core [Trinorchestia longiramus]|nr:ATPase AAA-type core [Trinorchestia longiramus]